MVSRRMYDREFAGVRWRHFRVEEHSSRLEITGVSLVLIDLFERGSEKMARGGGHMWCVTSNSKKIHFH